MSRPLRSALSFLSGVSLLLAAVSASAQTDAAASEALMRKSGLWQQLAELTPQVLGGMRAGAERADPKPAPAVTEHLLRAAEAAYSTPRLQAVALGTVAQNLNPAYVPTLQAWFDSPTGQSMRALEVAAAADRTEPATVVREGLALLEGAPSTRRALLNDIVEITKSAEVMTEITINLVLAVQRGVASTLPDKPAPPAEMLAALDAQRPQMLQNFALLSIASDARIYRDVPGDELSRYAAFLKSDAGRHFTALGAQAVNAAIVDASAAFGRGIGATGPAT